MLAVACVVVRLALNRAGGLKVEDKVEVGERMQSASLDWEVLRCDWPVQTSLAPSVFRRRDQPSRSHLPDDSLAVSSRTLLSPVYILRRHPHR